MSKRMVGKGLLVPALALAAALLGRPAAASMEEIFVCGTRPAEETPDAVMFQHELSEYMRSVNEAAKAKLDAELDAELDRASRPPLRVVAAEIRVRG